MIFMLVIAMSISFLFGVFSDLIPKIYTIVRVTHPPATVVFYNQSILA